jgi:hypothetical protein
MDHEECWSCGYTLAIHWLPLGWYDLDLNGGCPADEIDALRRWGLL